MAVVWICFVRKMEHKLDFSAQIYQQFYKKRAEVDHFSGKWEVIELQSNRNLRHLNALGF